MKPSRRPSAFERRCLWLLSSKRYVLFMLICLFGSSLFAVVTVGVRAQGGGSADLSVTKTGDESAPLGGLITYSVVVTDGGPDDSNNVVLSDPIPAHTTFVSASVSQGTVMFDGTVVDAHFGTIVPFESASLSLTVSVNSDTPRGTNITNTATAFSSTQDPDLSNNSGTFSTSLSGPFSGDVIISEFRFRGPTPSSTPADASTDEFIEIYNNTDAPIVVSDSGGSAGAPLPNGIGGWALVSSDAPTTPKFVVPNGTIIPARGHYLGVNSLSYSLSGYPAGTTSTAVGDSSYTGDIPDNGGIALFRTANSFAFDASTRFDAVGFNSVNPLFREGNGLTGPVTTNSEHSFLRKLASTVPQDTDDNATDFVLVAADLNNQANGAVAITAQLGAPGPENLGSPIQRNDSIIPTLIEPMESSSAAPNRVRVGSGSSGTLSVRRHFTNTTGETVTRLRFRVVNITTLGSPISIPPQADLRLTNSSDIFVTTSLGDLTVKGTIVEEPPAQPAGGGLNSSATVALPGPGIAPGETIDVQFLLNVLSAGNYRFFINVEALTEDLPPPQLNRRNTRKKRERATALDNPPSIAVMNVASPAPAINSAIADSNRQFRIINLVQPSAPKATTKTKRKRRSARVKHQLSPEPAVERN